MRPTPWLVLLGFAAGVGLAATPGVRSVFLNGVDVSSARSQDLKNVDVHINESGDVFIIAPHYQVNEEDSYVPLSKFVQGMNAPKHKPMQAVNGEHKPAPVAQGEGDAPKKDKDGLTPKAGEPADGKGPTDPKMVPASATKDGEDAKGKGDEPPPPLPGDDDK